MLALRGELARQGVLCSINRVNARTKACIINSMNFDTAYLYDVKRKYPGIRMVHRVDGPKAAYRGFDDGSDRKVWQYNRDLADATIFQSRFSLEEYRRMGFEFRDPVVIPNAVDPRIFNTFSRIPPPDGRRRIKVIATAWSDNPNKGADVHQWLDEHLDREHYEFCFVGRTQSVFRWAKVVAPVPSQQLAALLKQHDIYVAASINDPCSNALLEALACGVPVVYRLSGGHPELVQGAGVGFAELDDVLPAMEKVAQHYTAMQGAISVRWMANVAGDYLTIAGVLNAERSSNRKET